VWAREIDRRRTTSTSASASSPTTLALEHRRAVHDEAGDRSLHVGDLEQRTVRRGG
jgi:hypothetical protein